MNPMERTREIVQEDNGIALLSFSVGTLRFAVEAIHIRSIPDPDRSRETTAPALADLLGPTPARASALGPLRTGGSRERLLRVNRAAGQRTATFDVRVEEPVALCRTPIGALYPLPALMAALSALPCVRGVVRLSIGDADDLAILLDPRRLPQEDRVDAQGQAAAADFAA
ncbi:hypothetical protein THIOKS11760005 [Thiocapsa sp. KS1]|nr:hypothetical protein THIOKS11760005 [Thiocapsa sp. KS1]